MRGCTCSQANAENQSVRGALVIRHMQMWVVCVIKAFREPEQVGYFICHLSCAHGPPEKHAMPFPDCPCLLGWAWLGQLHVDLNEQGTSIMPRMMCGSF